MKNALTFLGLAILLIAFHTKAPVAVAACNWTNSATGYTAITCGIDAASSEYYDYSAAADDADNGYNVTIPNGVTVTVNAGTDASTLTKLGVGKFTLTGGGILAVSANFIQVSVGQKCYVLDSDADGYSATPTTCSTTGGAGYVRKNKLTATTVDCGDGSTSAKPGQTSYFTGTFTNGVNGALTHDWNCNGVETKQDSAIYTCAACTNGAGYASKQNLTTGFITAVPACNVSGTYYTVTSAVCQDPAVANCTAVSTNAAKTEACL